MATTERLDDEAVLELSRRTDELGVLSIYVNAVPGNPGAAAIDVRNRLGELRRRLHDSGSPEDRVGAIIDAMDRLTPEVEDLLRPGEPGRGRMLFAALADDWVVRLSSPLPVSTRVVLDDGPFVHPLLEMLDEGRRAGIVLVSAAEARLLEWRLGALQELSQVADEEVEAPHERAGQIGGGPRGRYDTPMGEHRQARRRERGERFVDRVIGAATRLAEERGWERILVSGGDRWTEPAVAAFPEPLRAKVIRDTRVLGGLDPAGLAAAVGDSLHTAHADDEAGLVVQVRDAGLSRTGALGLSEVVTALNQGRVSHLVYDPEVRYTGSLGDDGALYAGGEAPAGVSLRPEPRLTERLIERALQTGARVSPVEGAAAGPLADAAGIAALMRW